MHGHGAAKMSTALRRTETELNSIAKLRIEKKWNSSDLLGNGEE